MALWQKFSLIGARALALCLPPTVAVVLVQSQTLQTAGAALDGVAPVGALLSTLRLAQVHRGRQHRLAGWPGGNDSLRSKRASTAAELGQARATSTRSLSRQAISPAEKARLQLTIGRIAQLAKTAER